MRLKPCICATCHVVHFALGQVRKIRLCIQPVKRHPEVAQGVVGIERRIVGPEIYGIDIETAVDTCAIEQILRILVIAFLGRRRILVPTGKDIVRRMLRRVRYKCVLRRLIAVYPKCPNIVLICLLGQAEQKPAVDQTQPKRRLGKRVKPERRIVLRGKLPSLRRIAGIKNKRSRDFRDRTTRCRYPA